MLNFLKHRVKHVVILSFFLSVTGMKVMSNGIKDNEFESECLDTDFDITIEHKGSFGLDTKSLQVTKKDCEFVIRFKEYYLFSTEKTIDVCRLPIHIKSNKDHVIKRLGENCSLKKGKANGLGSISEYCQQVRKVKNLLQDHGLVFAKGLKEQLDSEHGKAFCAWKLINRYLDKGEVFSKY